MRPSRGSKQVPGSRRYLKCRRWLPSFSRAVSAAQAAESVAVALAEPRRGLASQAWTSRVPIPLARFNLRRQGPDAANAPTFQTYVRILGACSWFESGGPFRAPEGRLHHDCTKNSTTWAPTDLVGKRNQRNDPAHPRTTKTWLVLMTSEPATLTPSLDDRKQSPPPRMAPRSPFVVVGPLTLNRIQGLTPRSLLARMTPSKASCKKPTSGTGCVLSRELDSCVDLAQGNRAVDRGKP